MVQQQGGYQVSLAELLQELDRAKHSFIVGARELLDEGFESGGVARLAREPLGLELHGLDALLEDRQVLLLRAPGEHQPEHAVDEAHHAQLPPGELQPVHGE
jgi:hypothetical protein